MLAGGSASYAGHAGMTFAATGGAVAGGGGGIRAMAKPPATTFGLLLGASSRIRAGVRYLPSQGAVCGGSAPRVVSTRRIGSGGLVASGSAPTTRYRVDATGGNYMAVWTENQAVHVAAALNAGDRVTDNVDAASGNNDLTLVTVRLANAGAKDATVFVDVLPSTDGGTTYDSECSAADHYVITVRAGTTVVRTVQLDYPRAAVRVMNQGPVAVTYESWCALRKFVPA